jgi:hypothetical protein
VPREALAVLKAVAAAADPVCGEDKVVAIAEAVVVAVTPVLAVTRSQQESEAPARDGPRQERNQNNLNHAHLSSVQLTTQAWLLDCHPRD